MTRDPIAEQSRDYIAQLRELAKRQPEWTSLMRRMADCFEAVLEPRPVARAEPTRPRIVCLCGSTRFIELFATLSWELERDLGVIVLGLHYLPPSYPGIVADHLAEAEGVAEKMDELHKRKIDLADEILVLNVGGYIGESTRSEIVYAEAHGKEVRYLEPIEGLPARAVPAPQVAQS
jgi:hypothetical protein